MNSSSIVAKTLLAAPESASLFMNASRGAILIAGLSFFLLGMFLGSIIWGAYKGRAKRLTRETLSLLRKQESREADFLKHQEKYSPQKPEAESPPVS